MPVYKLITKEKLDDWMEELLIGFNNLYNEPKLELLCYWILKLFEYLQCYAKIKMEGVDKLKDVKITIKDLKIFIQSSNYDELINLWYNTRNYIGHDTNKKSIRNVLKLVQSNMFLSLLKEFNIDSNLLSSIKNAINVILNSDDIKDACHLECMFRLEESRNNKVELGKILHALYNNYPKSVVDTCVLDILSSDILTN